MDRKDVASNLVKVEELFNDGQCDDATDLLQECINASRLESKEFMERLKDETKDPQVMDSLQHMYFLNFV